MKNVVRDKDGECIHINEWDHDIQPVVNENAEAMTLGEARAMEAAGKNPDHLYDEEGNLVTEDKHPLPEGATQKQETIITLPDGGLAVEDAYIIRRRFEYGTPEQQLEFIVEYGIEAFIERMKAIKQKHPRRQGQKGQDNGGNK